MADRSAAEQPAVQPAAFCTGCGNPPSVCDGRCRRPLDPPRFCPTCARRMAVLVTPTRAVPRCRDHGTPVEPSAEA